MLPDEFPIAFLVAGLIAFPTLLAWSLMRGARAAGREAERPRPLAGRLRRTLIVAAGLIGLAVVVVGLQMERRRSALPAAGRVAAELERQGWSAPRVRPSLNTLCRRGERGFRWSAAGGRGSACSGRGGEVRIVVGRRWREADAAAH